MHMGAEASNGVAVGFFCSLPAPGACARLSPSDISSLQHVNRCLGMFQEEHFGVSYVLFLTVTLKNVKSLPLLAGSFLPPLGIVLGWNLDLEAEYSGCRQPLLL